MKWIHSFFIRVLKMGKIPKSIAIIMDGNRRYATKQHKEKHEGHSFGLKKLEDTLEWCLALGIKELTVFALSTDNLKRSKVEVDTLMNLCKNSFAKMAEKEGFMQQNGI
jgi:ditrans,polycis-polyprenyl diphosphate synthase